VKDRRSLTGADVDTSAMALHHLPFTGHANHALSGEPTCFSPSLSSPLLAHTHAKQWHCPSEQRSKDDEIPRGYVEEEQSTSPGRLKDGIN